MLKIKEVKITFGRYPLGKPFRISSGVIRDVPQMFVEVHAASGKRLVKGFGHNSVGTLWADRRALSIKQKEHEFRAVAKLVAVKLRGFSFSTPFDFYKKFVLKNKTKLTDLAYVMALSPIDLALWDAYAKLKEKNVFALPQVKSRLDYAGPRQVEVAHLVGIDDPVHSITRAIKNEGIGSFKVKLGGEPGADAERVNGIAGIKGVTQLTADANEAYGSLEDLRSFVGLLSPKALSKFLLIEQPFLRSPSVGVKNAGIKIPVFADESAIDHRDIKKLHKLGYKGVALKPHTKTFSGTLLCLDELRKRRMSWTIMDLTTAPPIGYFVGLGCGGMLKTAGGTELNGKQYYKNWRGLVSLGFPGQNKTFIARKGFVRPAGFFESIGWGIEEAAFKRYLTAAKQQYLRRPILTH